MVDANINKLVEFTLELSKASNDDSESAYQATWYVSVVLGLASIATGLGIAFWLSRGISTGINKMKAAAQGIAQGDVEQDVDVRSSDEIGETAAAFKEMIAYLSETAGVAGQIAAGNLTVRVQPKSDRDALGNAFAEMVRTLHGAMSETSAAATALAESKDQLAQVAEEAARAT